jgi:IstB-like ATP binding protein
VVVTSNKPFGRWSEVFDDAAVAAAMIDRLVHTQKWSSWGDSYGLKDRDLGRAPSEDNPHPSRVKFHCRKGRRFGRR